MQIASTCHSVASQMLSRFDDVRVCIQSSIASCGLLSDSMSRDACCTLQDSKGTKRARVEKNSGAFRFWHDERRFKGGADRCLVQQALFEAGGVRTGGYPKAAPVPGPLGFQRHGDWDMLWSPARSALKAMPLLKAGQLISAVPGMYCLTKKRRLSTTLAAAYGDEAWQLVPQSYSLPAELQEWKQWLQQQEAHGVDPGPWMLKTAQHLGKGLVLLPGQQAYQAAVTPRLPSAKPFVLAQRYVSNPLLINDCKFGIRLWLLITGVDPCTAYLHTQGLVLFSTDSYDLGSLSDDEGAAGRGHITNYAQNVGGTVWNLVMLKQHLGADVYKRLWNKLVSSAAHVACAAMGEVRQEHAAGRVPPNSTFELLGLDYLVDEDMHPWLLEVNGTPSLAVDHGDAPVEQLIHDTKNAMVQDMVNILNCSRRFLARYGQVKAGSKLPAPQAAAVRATLTRNDEASIRRRVEFELKHRGGFLPLMGHYPVLKYAGGVSSSTGIQQQGSDAGNNAEQEPPDAGQQIVASSVSSSVADVNGSGQPGSGPAFSERDKRLFVYMQSWWSKQRKLLALRRKVAKQQAQQEATTGEAAPAEQMQQDTVVLDQTPVAA
eukprot:GHUV01046010.1.p1 GENE.GHUV01046010.1~~GHUV01046010.1.p1  ORF type:complete len:602 (+),score=176.12 GHUV01046010.1:192-1997(+)